MLFNVTGHRKKENENPSQGGLGAQTNDCHTSKQEEVSVKVGILCSAVKPWPSFLYFLVFTQQCSSALPVTQYRPAQP